MNTTIGSGGWKDAAFGVAYLGVIGSTFVGVTAVLAALFVGH